MYISTPFQYLPSLWILRRCVSCFEFSAPSWGVSCSRIVKYVFYFTSVPVFFRTFLFSISPTYPLPLVEAPAVSKHLVLKEVVGELGGVAATSGWCRSSQRGCGVRQTLIIKVVQDLSVCQLRVQSLSWTQTFNLFLRIYKV